MLTLILGGTALAIITGQPAYILTVLAGWIAGDLIEKHTEQPAGGPMTNPSRPVTHTASAATSHCPAPTGDKAAALGVLMSQRDRGEDPRRDREVRLPMNENGSAPR